METRTSDNLYLTKSYVPAILGAKLPSYRQAFGYFLHLHRVEKLTLRYASRKAIKVVSEFWQKASVSVKAEQHCIKKLESVFDEWKGLQKHKMRSGNAHTMHEHEFVLRLEELFDIAHQDALDLIKNPQDKAFLLRQREKGRPGCIGVLDKVNESKVKAAEERNKAETRRRQRSLHEMAFNSSKVALASSSDDDDIDHELKEYKPSAAALTGTDIAQPEPKKAKLNMLSPGLMVALDQTQTSSRNAVYLWSETASSLGHNVDSLNISRNSIHRARSRSRIITAIQLKSEFSSAVPLTVHWDGKLMLDLTTKQHTDRLPILISGVGCEQLLAVPKLACGSGEVQAAAVVNALKQWGIEQRVTAMCFDTTASNTGHRQGACTLIEQMLSKDLLYFACRHHIMELVVGAAFEQVLQKSTGPEITLFKRFQEHWYLIEHNKYQPAATDPDIDSLVDSSRNEILDFARVQLEEKQPRDDYREFLEISMIYLGEVPPKGIHFQCPGAMHRARWLSKVLYSIKMWLFRDQFRLTKSELKGITAIAAFGVLVYLTAWISAPVAVNAPLNDFVMMRQLLGYPEANISSATSKSLGRHLWYLSEELVALALFDSRVPAETKKLMLAAMENSEPDHPPKRPQVEISAFQNQRGLEQFCTTNSMTLFCLLQLPTSFLSKEPSEWQDDETYKTVLTTVKGLAVVNDRAERGVALIQDFNKKLTKDEDQLQYLLQVVSEHRRLFPDCTKSTVMKATSSKPSQ